MKKFFQSWKIKFPISVSIVAKFCAFFFHIQDNIAQNSKNELW